MISMKSDMQLTEHTEEILGISKKDQEIWINLHR